MTTHGGSLAPGHNRFPGLDGLRFVAAFLVVCAHTLGFGYENLGLATQFVHSLGHYGVAVFFALSGFLLFRPFVASILDDRAMPAIGGYLRRRFLRIYPLFWVALLAYVFLLPRYPGSMPTTPWGWIGMISMNQVYFDKGIDWGISAAWTLGVELAFYLALPLLARGFRWLARKFGDDSRDRLLGVYAGLFLFAVVGLAFKLAVLPAFHPGSALSGNPLAWTEWFAGGMALSTVVVASERGHAIPGPLKELGRYTAGTWLLSILCFWISVQTHYYFLVFPSIPQTLVRHFAMGLAGLLLLLPMVIEPAGGGAIRSFLGWRPIYALGTVSYGIYLWHPGLARLYWENAFKGHKVHIDLLVHDFDVKFPLNRAVALAFVSIGAIALATLTYWGVEKLFMTFRGKSPSSAPPRNVAPPSVSGQAAPGGATMPAAAPGAS